jgi:signal transduction histidine kinase
VKKVTHVDEKTSPEINELVVVGSSAGGIEALSILVSSLPKDFPAPIVLAQHLDPFRPSNLDQILERRSTLPIVVVQDSTELGEGKVYVVPANRHVAIRDGLVRLEDDHGPGISPEHLKTIFNRFYQISDDKRQSRSGLGLGLYIAKNIIEQHGGEITVQSKPGDGSAFIFKLPLIDAGKAGK